MFRNSKVNGPKVTSSVSHTCPPKKNNPKKMKDDLDVPELFEGKSAGNQYSDVFGGNDPHGLQDARNEAARPRVWHTISNRSAPQL